MSRKPVSRGPWWSALAALVLICPATVAEPPTAREYDVKAACLFNIAKFSDWPERAFPQPGAPLVIGVLGEDPFGTVLDRIVKGRVVNDHPVVIRRASDAAELKDAHVIFVCASERSHAVRICSSLESTHALTVGDCEETATVVAVNFSVADGRTVFAVNLARATRAGVRISSKLLALARSVHDTPR